MVAPSHYRPLNILLADDGSTNLHPAIQLMARLPHHRECQITSLRVFTPLQGSKHQMVEAQAEKTNNELKSRHFHFRTKLVCGYSSQKIIEYAQNNSPDLIVVGSKKRGRLGGLLGNIATSIVHSGHWPVLIVRDAYKGLKNVLMVIDDTVSSQTTCDYLRNFPLPEGAQVTILHVLPVIANTYTPGPYGMTMMCITDEEETRLRHEQHVNGIALLKAMQKSLAEQQDMHCSTMLLRGDATSKILEVVKNKKIDMLVCGSRGSGNLTGWLVGSVSRAMVQWAPCSVLVVRNMPEI